MFFLIPRADRDEIIAIIRARTGSGDAEGMKWTGARGEHPPAIELFLGKRYFTVTNRHLHGVPEELRVVDPDDLRWIIDEAGPALAARPEAAANGHDPDGPADLDQIRIEPKPRDGSALRHRLPQGAGAAPRRQDLQRDVQRASRRSRDRRLGPREGRAERRARAEAHLGEGQPDRHRGAIPDRRQGAGRHRAAADRPAIRRRRHSDAAEASG